MTTQLLGRLAGTLGLVAALAAGPALAAFPERPISLIVPFAAGGGTDVTARHVAAALERELGVPVNVVNREGAGALIGHAAVAEAEPDGYTLGITTSVIGLFHWTGQSDLTWEDLTPLVYYNLDPAGFQVNARAPYQSVEDVLDAVRADPSQIRVSGGARMGAWHFAYLELLLEQGIDPSGTVFVPLGGAAPTMNELVAGGIELAPTSLPEARGMIDAGRVRALATMAEERHPLFPDVPTIKEAIGSDVVSGAWRGVSAPPGLPDDVRERLVEALTNAYESAEFQEAMTQGGFGLRYMGPEAFAEFLAYNDAAHGEILRAIGDIQ
jgi:tripartite-type tricarboxylate transporter receptor subunit TctC